MSIQPCCSPGDVKSATASSFHQPRRCFLPVHTTGRPATALPDAGDKPNGRPAGQIEIELKDGSRVRVDADVSLASLRRVIAALRW
jgi:hypothetical protein